MALSADDDSAQAVMRKFAATPGLVALVPGGLERMRLHSFQPGVAPSGEELPPKRKTPYGTFEVTKGQEALHNTGSGFVDIRLVRMEFRGKESEAKAILSYIISNQVFNRKTLETESPFLACLVAEEQDLKKDPATKDGEDIWIGTYAFNVWTDREE